MRPRRLAPAVLAALAIPMTGCGGGSPAHDTGTPAPRDSAGAAPAQAQAAGRGVRLVPVGRFTNPLYVTAPPGDRRRIFVVEQDGRIMVVHDGRPAAHPFLDIRGLVLGGDEQGLLSLAFAPDYARTGRFYVYYTEKAGTESIWEYRRATAERANPSSARLVLRMADPESNHNGGLMVFHQGLMYVGTGDGGGGDDQHGARGNAQSLGSLLGKILRIDPRAGGGRAYRVPASNPFAGRAGARGEIYAYGLRNPWRFSFDRATGALTIGDVGQDAVEEIDFTRAGRARGANFGWRPWEGRRRNFDEPAPGAVFPLITHSHDAGFCSITGGYVVRDRSVPSLYGRYVYGDYCEGRIRAAMLRAGRPTTVRVLALPGLPALSSFGEDARGRVYVTSLNGPVYRLASR